METAVVQVSRYLDRRGATQSSPKHGLLTVAFCRTLRRYAAKLSRLEPMGGWSEFSNHPAAENWIAQVNARLDLEKMVRKLSDRNGFVLILRAAGFEWKEIAQILGTSPAALRNGFWREVEKLRVLP
jgi:DNA-directed RNA polymerase specialized sigma24 family protein